MSDDDPFKLSWKTPPQEVGDPHTITQRLMRAMLTSEDKTLLIEKLDRDLSRHKALVEEAFTKIRLLELGHADRFTREHAKLLFADLFKDDVKERAFLARLVKIIYIPLALLATAALIEALVRLFSHARP